MKAQHRLNQCGEGQLWEDQKGGPIYSCALGTSVVTFFHPRDASFRRKVSGLS